MSLQQWRTRVENSRLSCKDDWKLPGASLAGAMPVSRTRFGGSGRPNLARKVLEEHSSDESWLEEQDLTEECDEEDMASFFVSEDDDTEMSEEATTKTKPDPTRVIMEVDALAATLTENCRCTECDSKVQAEFKTTCLATHVELTCTNSDCGYIYYSNPPAQVKTANVDKRERSTDYAINILYVLGFISCGDGCTEAARVLGLLGHSSE
jgi:hypothetical protein